MLIRVLKKEMENQSGQKDKGKNQKKEEKEKKNIFRKLSEG